MKPEALVGLLAEPERLFVFAALVLGARTPDQVGESTGLGQREVHKALQRLVAGGLVVPTTDGRYLPVIDAFKQAARSAAPPAAQQHDYADHRVAAVIRAFVRDGRLTGLPVQLSKRRILLEHVVQSFEPGRDFSEQEVNALLRAWTEGGPVDYVTVRRYLVDEGLLSRTENTYRRSGGWVDVLSPPPD
jgi:hypothetical protein